MPAAFALVRPPLSSRCWSVVAADSICMASKRSEDGDPWNPTATLINRLRMQCADTAGTVPCIQSEAQHNYRPARRDTAHQFSVPPASPGLLVPRHLLSRRLAQRSIFFPLPLIILAKG
jgi:hypothetical protein